MKQRVIVPHVVIEGSYTLARRLHYHNSPPPLVLTARTPSRRHQTLFLPCDLIRPVPEDDYWRCYARESLLDLLKRERRRLGCGDEPLRLVVAGSHGALCYAQYKARSKLGAEAYSYLDEVAAHQRIYARDLYAALKGLKQFEFHWLAEALPPEFRPSRATAPQRERFARVVDMARTDLAERPFLRTVSGAVPLLYTYNGLGWHLFNNGYFQPEPKGAATKTRQLLEQYKAKPDEKSVLVKLLPADRARRNPCDNPMVSLADLEFAKERGVSTVLLDQKRGVIDRTSPDGKKDKAEVIGI